MIIPDELLEQLANEYIMQVNKSITFEKYLLLNQKMIEEYRKKNKCVYKEN